MASNPPNPFNINQLNGVTFGAGTLFTPADKPAGDGQPSQPAIDPTSQGSYIKVNFAQAYLSYVSGTGTGNVTVTNTNYTAGYTQGGSYFLPTFGAVQFENIQYVDINGEPFGAKTWWVHGFTDDGLILSLDQKVADTTIRTNPGRTLVLDRTPNAVTFPATFDKDPNVYCFAAGTRIETASGPTPVEDLVEGDIVLTAAGERRPVKWIGTMLVRPRRHRQAASLHPVRVTAHAFAENVPARDVRLSPGHAVLVDGVLVPVGFLVNDATIFQEEVDEVRYFHVELDTHDAVMCDGLACETYLDDGNRHAFANSGEFVELHGRLDPRSWDNACAPMVAAGPQLVELQQRLIRRAEAMGWRRSEETSLRIDADGVEIAPMHVAGDRHWFAVPAATVLTLRSAANVLSRVMPGLSDGRLLGVAVSEVRVNGAAIALDGAEFGAGFHAVERHGDHEWRWTDGAARLELDGGAPAMIEVAVTMVAPSWRAPERSLQAVA